MAGWERDGFTMGKRRRTAERGNPEVEESGWRGKCKFAGRSRLCGSWEMIRKGRGCATGRGSSGRRVEWRDG